MARRTASSSPTCATLATGAAGRRSSCATASKLGGRRGITGPGYLQPSYSRDGRWLAATRTSTLGNDVVIINGRTGEEVLRVTSDDASFDPVWSPAGDAIAYLHLSGQTVDLRLAKLSGEARAWTVDETIRPDRGVRPRPGVRPGLVHPGVGPAAPADGGRRARPSPARRRRRPSPS